MTRREVQCWAIKRESKNLLDGHRVWFDGCPAPPHTRLFKTRTEARDYIRKNYDYFRRKDLRAEPHGWRMPKPVRVHVAITAMRNKT